MGCAIMLPLPEEVAVLCTGSPRKTSERMTVNKTMRNNPPAIVPNRGIQLILPVYLLRKTIMTPLNLMKSF